MKPELKSKIDEMLELYQTVSKDFRWQNSLYRHLAALTYITKDKDYDSNKVESLMRYIKERTGIFSYFRTHCFMISVFLCSQYENPEEMFLKMLDYADKLRDAGFKSSMYLPVSAYTLLSTCEEVDVNSRIYKAYDVYTQMKKLHPWLTTSDDYALCILLAGSDENSSEVMESIEECYKALRSRGFSRSNGLQFLSHIISFSRESAESKAERCSRIYNLLSENHLHIYSSYYAALGLLTLEEGNIEDIVCETIEITDYLKHLKSYKWLGKGMNILIASSLISTNHMEERRKQGDLADTALSVSIDALIAAQQAAAIAGASAAISVSTSSGS